MGDRKSFLLRVDPQVHDALKRWAEDELRSLNAQAEMVLREALRRAGRLPREGKADGASEDAPPEASASDEPGAS
jgi:hypothetical protein